MAKLKILPKRIEILDANDPCCIFRINIDVLNECFGANKSMYMHACYPQSRSAFIRGTIPGDIFIVWMPKLYSNSSEWKNSISNDKQMIYEIAEPTRHSDWMEENKHSLSCMRLVFAKHHPFSPYQFEGVFINEDMSFLKHSYKRIATKVRLIGNPVHTVELLDDMR